MEPGFFIYLQFNKVNLRRDEVTCAPAVITLLSIQAWLFIRNDAIRIETLCPQWREKKPFFDIVR